jgi:hypothetical protein
MANSGLNGPYVLSAANINAVVTQKSPGAYALGDSQGDVFYISRVGRSDTDVNARLKSYEGKYNKFKYGYFPSAKAAFEKECHLYHDFDPPDNVIHPDRPEGSNWSCPRCRVFG